MSKTRKRHTGRQRSLDSLLALAEQAGQKGQPKKAMQYLREAVARKPRDGRPYFYLGKLYKQAGQLKNALACYEQAQKIEPDNVAVQLNCANTLQAMGKLEAAKSAYQGVLSQAPEVAVGHFNLGIVLERMGKQLEAAESFRTAAELQPDLHKAQHRLAQALTRAGQYPEAIDAYRHAIAKSPRNPELHRELGDLFDKAGSPSAAETSYKAALELEPDNEQTWYSLGIVQQQMGRFDDAIASYEKSLELQPRQILPYASLGNTLHQVGEVEQAANRYQAALEHAPTFAHARLGATISQLPIIYESEDHILESRQQYSKALDELVEYYAAAPLEERAEAADAIGFLQPFYLSYQGLPMRDLNKRYGELLSLLTSARYPEFVTTPEMPSGTEKIRLGVASGFLRNHSSWNIFQGLVEAIDRSRFELFLFHTRNECDRETRLLQHLCDGFVQGPLGIEQWARTVREHRLHALFFPEFGMDPVSIQLGCLRLAPIQMTSWGHPVTSGLETIDYYLSSDLMEPESAQDDYSEKLVRLPNSSMHYRLPVVDPEPMERADLDVPDGSVIYWCCQSLFKYLPRHDDVFPRVAKEVPNAAFIFIGKDGGIVERQFRSRMAAAFEREGLDMDTYCHFVPPLTKPVFAAMTALSDIFLDSIGWSGCNSAMEAIGADRPILTLPGDFMRGRHCKSFLEIMGLDEWIAEDKDEFLAMAIRLGKDEGLRRTLSEQVREHKVKLYRDPEPVRAFESLLEDAVANYTPALDEGVSPGSPETSNREETACSSGPDESPEVLWSNGVTFQNQGQLDKASLAFQRSLDLSNPAYAAAEPGPSPRLTQSIAAEQGEIELNGLSYPAITPVPENEHRPFWSVVIPVYNRDLFLLECLASVLSQWPGEDEMEIIVIDNGSVPSLEPLVESIGKGIVTYHRHAETLPLQANWNSAVRACRGHWVHLLHDDDYVLPGFYQALQDGLEDAPDTIGAAFTAYENINEHNEVIFRNRVFGSKRGVAAGWINKIGISNVLNPPAVVVRREAYERVGGYSEDILYTTDWELYLRLVSFYDWWYEPDILVHYRQHAFNVTAEQNKAGAQGEAFWKAIAMAEQYLPEQHLNKIIPRSRRYYFNWCLERLRLPLLAGNPPGAQRLLQEMLHIDRSEESLADLFDWLGTTFASPMWPAIEALYQTLPDDQKHLAELRTAELFDWLRFDSASGTRQALAETLMHAPAIEIKDEFQLTP